MKTLTKISILILCVCGLQQTAVKAQCTPDPNIPVGIFPETLAPAGVDTPYTQVVLYKAPLDTTVNVPPFGDLPVRVDSMLVMDVIGLPQGFSYQCHVPSCMINGGEAGCITLSGTATTAGVYPVKVVIKTWATVQGAIPIQDSQIDTNEKYTLYVSTPVGINEHTLASKLSVYPNPAKDVVNIEMNGVDMMNAKVILMDISGRLLQEITFDGRRTTLPIADMKPGIYLLQLQTAYGSVTKKLIIE